MQASAKQKRKQKYELFKKQKVTSNSTIEDCIQFVFIYKLLKEAKQVRKVTKFSEEGLEKVAQMMAEQ